MDTKEIERTARDPRVVGTIDAHPGKMAIQLMCPDLAVTKEQSNQEEHTDMVIILGVEQAHLVEGVVLGVEGAQEEHQELMEG